MDESIQPDQNALDEKKLKQEAWDKHHEECIQNALELPEIKKYLKDVILDGDALEKAYELFPDDEEKRNAWLNEERYGWQSRFLGIPINIGDGLKSAMDRFNSNLEKNDGSNDL